MSKFVHLNIHSDYSIKDSICKIHDILLKVYKLNMSSVAITDFFSLSVVIKFFKYAFKYGIKPIVGSDMNIYLCNENNSDFFSVTVLVMNKIGFVNLIKLISISYKCSYKKFIPFLHYSWLLKFNEGLIFLFSIDKYSNIIKYLINGDYTRAKKIIFFWEKYFNNRLYFQIFRVKNKDENKYINIVIDLSIETNIPLVATNKVLFLNKDDFYLHKIKSSIYYNCTFKKVKNIIDYTNQQYLKNELEMLSLFRDIPESLQNTVEISKRCNFFLKKRKFNLPKFKENKNINNSIYIRKLIYKNFSKKNIKFTSVFTKKLYIERIKYELNIIISMGFVDYFLIVMEFVNWAKKHYIPVGVGRGSGSSSLVSYLLNITDIDPIKYDLFFERFLNPNRVSMPDFDIDFCMYRRDEVFLHIKKLYGKKSVSKIVTFNTMTAKSVIRDVGRVLGYPYYFIDKIAKLIPFDLGITLKKSILEPKLKDLYNTDKDVKYLIDISSKLEGLIKGIGKHAGGIVISPSKITDFCSIYYDLDNDFYITQFDKNDIEYVGLIKFDLLGLRTLTIIDNTINMINDSKLILNKINISNILLNDKKSFVLLNDANTTAVFQLESNGMKDLIRRLKPGNFEDIVSLLALFRPGPLQSGMVDNFVNRKNGKESIYYPDKNCQHSLLVPILKNTYGIILYQEQIMKIAIVLANYSFSDADMLQRYISKKNYKKVKLFSSKFLQGSKKLGVSLKIASKVFFLIEKFSRYGFNRSHSVSYAYLAYRTLWLKSNYPSEFMSSVINSYIDNTNKIMVLINNIKNMNIKIIPLNINISSYYFYVNEKKDIVYGIGAIKGLGEKLINYILDIRNKVGKFKNFVDFCVLIYNNKINKSTLKKLILSGLFDVFNVKRSILIDKYKYILNFAKYKKDCFNFTQLSMFDVNNLYLLNEKSFFSKFDDPLWTKEYELNKEKEVLGLYVSDHPINIYNNYIDKFNVIKIKNLNLIENKVNINLLGLIILIKFLLTKNNNRICLLKIDDGTGFLDILIYKKIYLKYCNFIEINNIILINGSLKLNIISEKFLVLSKLKLIN